MALAKEAYSIYRGTRVSPPYEPHWDDLTREQRGMIEWVVRYTLMQFSDAAKIAKQGGSDGLTEDAVWYPGEDHLVPAGAGAGVDTGDCGLARGE